MRALRSSALVTLLGPGGIGKSRLALAVADLVVADFPDGVWFVDLTAVPAEGAVEESVLGVIAGIDHSRNPPRDRVTDLVRDSRMLLILDNCEHVRLEVAAFVGGILSAARDVRVLATSREALGGFQEHVVPVQPLAVPDPARVRDAVDALTYDSVRLFVDRATAVQAGFKLDASTFSDVAAICARLDGWPLAIELAASRLRSLAVSEVRDELDDRLHALHNRDVMTPSRHRSLRAVIDWSWELCEPAEQLLWSRASVFSADGFDLQAARTVCADDSLSVAAVWDALDRLVSKSILLAAPSGTSMRYRFLETIWQYGRERLRESGANALLDRRHRDYFSMLAADSDRDWTTSRQVDSVQVLDTERANLTQAMEWSLATAGEADRALLIATHMRQHWGINGSLRDGRRWLTRGLDAVDADCPDRPLGLLTLAWVSMLQGDMHECRRRLAEVERVVDRRDDPQLRARLATLRGIDALWSERVDDAVETLGEALDFFYAHETVDGVMFTSIMMIRALAQAGDYERAAAVADRAGRVSAARGELWGPAQYAWALGYCMWLQGDHDAALALVRRGLDRRLEFDTLGLALKLDTLSWIAASRHEYVRSGRLLGAAGATWARMGTSISAHGAHFTRNSARCRETLRRALPPARLAEEIAAGAALGYDDLVDYATGRETPRSTASSRQRPFTRREREVAALLGEGLGTGEIAERLFLSNRTVEGHITHALSKLGVKSRVQLAAWAARALPVDGDPPAR